MRTRARSLRSLVATVARTGKAPPSARAASSRMASGARCVPSRRRSSAAGHRRKNARTAARCSRTRCTRSRRSARQRGRRGCSSPSARTTIRAIQRARCGASCSCHRTEAKPGRGWLRAQNSSRPGQAGTRTLAVSLTVALGSALPIEATGRCSQTPRRDWLTTLATPRASIT